MGSWNPLLAALERRGLARLEKVEILYQTAVKNPMVSDMGSWNPLVAALEGARSGLARKSADRRNPVVKNPMVSGGGPGTSFPLPPEGPGLAWLEKVQIAVIQ